MSKGRKSHRLLGLGWAAIACCFAPYLRLALLHSFRTRDSGEYLLGLSVCALHRIVARCGFRLILRAADCGFGRAARAPSPAHAADKMVFKGRSAVSFLPVVFVFSSVCIVNRTLVLWFPARWKWRLKTAGPDR